MFGPVCMCRIIPRPLFIGISVMPLSFLWLSAPWDLLKEEGYGLKMRMIRDTVCKILPSGEVRAGKVHDIGQQCLCFYGNRWHSAEDWTGLSRWVIAGFVPMGYERTTPEQWKSLTELGFPVEKIPSGSPEPRESSVNVAKLEETKGPLVEWEVEVPCWIVEDVGLDAWLRWQEGELCLRKFVTEELSK